MIATGRLNQADCRGATIPLGMPDLGPTLARTLSFFPEAETVSPIFCERNHKSTFEQRPSQCAMIL